MWYCGDIPKNIPPYRMLRSCDLKHLNSGKSTLSMMRRVMKQVERAVTIVNQPHLIKQYMNEQGVFALYHGIKHLLKFDCLQVKKRRKYEIILWKIYYNILLKRGNKLLGESTKSTQQPKNCRKRNSNPASQARRMIKRSKPPQQRKNKKQKSTAASQALELFGSSFPSIKRIVKKHGSGALEDKKM